MPMYDTWVQLLGQEYPLEKEMATHASILAWKIIWTEEPGRLQSMESLRVRQNLMTKQQPQRNTEISTIVMYIILMEKIKNFI